VLLAVAAVWLVGFATLGGQAWFYVPSMLMLPVAAGVAVATGVLSRWAAAGLLLAFILVDFVVGDHARWSDLPFFAVVLAVWLLIAAGARWCGRRVVARRARRTVLASS
jgi:hypothetical protein